MGSSSHSSRAGYHHIHHITARLLSLFLSLSLPMIILLYYTWPAMLCALVALLTFTKLALKYYMWLVCMWSVCPLMSWSLVFHSYVCVWCTTYLIFLFKSLLFEKHVSFSHVDLFDLSSVFPKPCPPFSLLFTITIATSGRSCTSAYRWDAIIPAIISLCVIKKTT